MALPCACENRGHFLVCLVCFPFYLCALPLTLQPPFYFPIYCIVSMRHGGLPPTKDHQKPAQVLSDVLSRACVRALSRSRSLALPCARGVSAPSSLSLSLSRSLSLSNGQVSITLSRHLSVSLSEVVGREVGWVRFLSSNTLVKQLHLGEGCWRLDTGAKARASALAPASSSTARLRTRQSLKTRRRKIWRTVRRGKRRQGQAAEPANNQINRCIQLTSPAGSRSNTTTSSRG